MLPKSKLLKILVTISKVLMNAMIFKVAILFKFPI